MRSEVDRRSAGCHQPDDQVHLDAEVEVTDRLPSLPTMSDPKDFNTAIIDEFRANDGNVGGGFKGAPMLLLHSKGARSGVERVNPMVYQQVGDDYVVFASKGGRPTNPDWYHNLVANPDATIEVGSDTIPVTARAAEGEERERIWTKQKEIMPGFADYEQKTTRQIPVVILTPRR